jgi:two-component system invasion response regulator UvrY
VGSVYIVEAQSLFLEELARIIASAGGSLVGTSESLDFETLIRANPDYALLDLDFTAYDVVEVLAVLHAEAPRIQSLVLTGQQGAGWLERARKAGAASVLSKEAGRDELIHDLRVILDGGALWDARVEVR